MTFPNVKDISGAIEGIIRVQDAYDLDVTEVCYNILNFLSSFNILYFKQIFLIIFIHSFQVEISWVWKQSLDYVQ